jgi:hypothetical protein
MSFYRDQYETVAASQTDQALGDTGAAKDLLLRLVVTVTAADAGSAVTIKDGSGSDIPVVPASAPIGVYAVDFGPAGIRSRDGAWQVTTGASATVIASGRFGA